MTTDPKENYFPQKSWHFRLAQIEESFHHNSLKCFKILADDIKCSWSQAASVNFSFHVMHFFYNNKFPSNVLDSN